MLLTTLLLVGPASGCGGPAGGEADADHLPGDEGGHDALDARVDDASTVSEPNAERPSEPMREVVASEIIRHCPGCDAVRWCGMPPMSDSTTLTLVPAPNDETGMLFASERYEAAGRRLEAGTCRRYEGADLEPVTGIPSGVDVRDVGDISLAGEMPALEQPMVAQFKTITHNYVATARPIERSDWAPGADLRLSAPGGADLDAFAAETTASDPFLLLGPSVDETGSVSNADLSLPLQVSWEGGSDHTDAVVLLEAMYCNGGVLAVVACRPQNEGTLTVPAELLDGLDRVNVVMLYLSRSRKVPLPIAGLAGRPAWSVRSVVVLPIFLDELARGGE